MAEFGLIQRLQEIIEPALPARNGCVLGIGDDAAVLELPAGRQLVVCTDTLVEGVHFSAATAAGAIGHKSLAVNLSDLAAMGADPAWFFLALTLPDADQRWLDDFAHGMADLASEAGILLAGGDTTSGSLSICITALGFVDAGQALTRSGAKAGDLLLVSGEPGAAAHALACVQSGRKPLPEDIAALEFPRPRLALGKALRGLASSCIDLSDGLLADLGHILDASDCGAELFLDALPRPRSLAGLPDDVAWPLQLSGGDDYELCFTIPASERSRLDSLSNECHERITLIGRITDESGIVLTRPGGEAYECPRSGYEHFSSKERKA